jgi:deoxyribodipyrimidine photo-lyase
MPCVVPAEVISSSRRAIVWFRRDLRLDDNRTLESATAHAERVWPVFVADPELLTAHASAPGRVAWFDANIRALDQRLRDAGSGLTVLRGRPEVVLRDFAAQVGAEAVHAGADEEPVAVARDARVAQVVDLRLVDDQRIVPPGELHAASGEPYRVYSPFRRALDARIQEAPDDLLRGADARLDRLAPPPAGEARLDGAPAPYELPPAGEAAAAERLRSFLSHDIDAYGNDRDRPALDRTSRLSPYLRVGAISIRACWRAIAADRYSGHHGPQRRSASRMTEGSDTAEREARAAAQLAFGLDRPSGHPAPAVGLAGELTDPSVTARSATAEGAGRGGETNGGARAWRGELAWREFFAHLLAAHPDVVEGSLRPEFQDLPWVDGAERDELLAAWRIGHTGYPFVDAGMRQLMATGWMHNRARLVTASFLVKDLGIDWRIGESVFMDHLLDGDTAQNNGNWQWVAGVGTDAAPYFRVLNPTLQANRFDPDGAYVRRWVPEVAHLPAPEIHEPWRSARPPDDYPTPIVDHAEARQRTLARYRAVER